MNKKKKCVNNLSFSVLGDRLDWERNSSNLKIYRIRKVFMKLNIVLSCIMY